MKSLVIILPSVDFLQFITASLFRFADRREVSSRLKLQLKPFSGTLQKIVEPASSTIALSESLEIGDQLAIA